MRLRYYGLFSLLALGLAGAAHADPSLHLAGGAGLSWGGDTLAKIQYTNGDETQVKAGGLVYINVGPAVDFTGSPISMQALLGYQFDQDNAANGDVKFDRTTLDALVFYNAGCHHIGAGMAYHFSPEYHQAGYYDPNTGYPVPSVDAKFKDSSGLELAYEFRQPHSNLGLTVRAVSIKYDVDSVTQDGLPAVSSKTSFDGSFVAVGITFYL